MIKRLTVAVAALFALAAQAFAAGTLPGFSLTPQFDLTGRVAPGCFLYVIQAGTVSTPQNAYQDSGLTLLAANPLRCDAAGRLPQWFVADGTIKVRLTKGDGTQIFVGDNLLVVGASSGGGGGSPVDPTTVMATGDVKVRYGTGVLSGFVRMNGRTIGSASSGATERANADVQALFEYLWTADPNLTVSSGRGLSANADWVANKTMALPDMRTRMLAGLDDMGSSLALRMPTCTNSTVLGSGCGVTSDQRIIAQLNLPAYTLPDSVNFTVNDAGHTHTVDHSSDGGTAIFESTQDRGSLGPSVRFLNYSGGSGAAFRANSATTGISLSRAGTVTSGGSGAALPVLNPTMLMTFYQKL